MTITRKEKKATELADVSDLFCYVTDRALDDAQLSKASVHTRFEFLAIAQLVIA